MERVARHSGLCRKQRVLNSLNGLLRFDNFFTNLLLKQLVLENSGQLIHQKRVDFILLFINLFILFLLSWFTERLLCSLNMFKNCWILFLIFWNFEIRKGGDHEVKIIVHLSFRRSTVFRLQKRFRQRLGAPPSGSWSDLFNSGHLDVPYFDLLWSLYARAVYWAWAVFDARVSVFDPVWVLSLFVKHFLSLKHKDRKSVV